MHDAINSATAIKHCAVVVRMAAILQVVRLSDNLVVDVVAVVFVAEDLLLEMVLSRALLEAFAAELLISLLLARLLVFLCSSKCL